MSKLKTLLGILVAAWISVGPLLLWCGAAEKGNPETRITNLRFLVKGNRTCLIFDAEGAKPKQIGPASADGISVFFSQMTTRLPDKAFKDRGIKTKEVKFRHESSFFEVLFHEKNTTVSSKIQPGKNGKYTLTLELTPAATDSEPSASAKPASVLTEKAPQVEVKKVETSELFASKVSQQVKNSLANAAAAGLTRDAKQGGSGPASGSNAAAFAEPDEFALTLYASANEMFENCSRNLVSCAPDIIEAYDEALKAGPMSSQAPLAIYRSALAQYTMGNYEKADKLFRQVTSRWPDHPVASRCWIGTGDVYNRRQAYLEAMEAFRWALRGAGDSKDKAAAQYKLGKEYLTLGANKEALEMLENCVGLEPDYYTREPDVLRCIGEAHFALGNMEKAKEHLLKYINYQQGAPDQDVVLAKIAEIFLVLGEPNAAKKMYAFVGKYYADSEGDVVCTIRKAELMEKDDMDRAIKIYNDLRAKDLSPSLRKVVSFKLAALNLKKCNLTRSLDIMDEAFPIKNDGSSPPGTAALRERILCDLAKRHFTDKEYLKVIQLQDKYRRVFDSLQSPDTLGLIAESYANLKFYSNSLQIFDTLISKGQKKGDDLLLRCALYALRINDNDKCFQYCKLAQSDALDLKKSEILGHVFYRDQKYGEAVKYFGKVVQKGKEFELEDPDSYEVYGYSLYQTKKFDEAVPILQKALQRAKTDNGFTRRSIMTTMAKSFAEQKQFQKAAETMEMIIGFSGEEQKNELLYEVSKLYMAAGQTDKAIQSLNQIKGTEHQFWSAVAQQQLNTIDMSQAKQ